MTKDRDDEMQESTSLIRSGTVPENRLLFSFSQKEALDRGVLVASYWWRKPQTAALEQFAEERDCDLVSVGDLIDAGELQVMDGHGSPNSHLTGRGPVPYVKVVDIKNWRIIENPSYGIPADTADHLRKGRYLRSWDIVSPTRASRNIGLFGVLELVRDRRTMEPMAPFNGSSDEMRALDRYLLDHGVYTMVRWWDVMTNPPLCITEAQLDEGFAVINDALAIADRAVKT